MQADEKFEMVAKTFKGLEDVLRDELISLGAADVETGCRMVSFKGDKAMLYKANLCCRTALRILKPIVKFNASDPDELYDAVRDFEWDSLLTPDKTFSIDSTVNSAEFTHSKFVTYRVKDGIADYFNDKYRRRPSIRLSGADVQLNVHISDNRVTISLDSSGEPLSKRGYRVEQTEAPINEVMAAGIILKTGWRGGCDFVDPMCGSGTFLIEAALIAANINPGIFRQHYAFETWEDFDSDLFSAIYNDDSEEREPACRILGGDIARAAVAVAQKNIAAAGVEEYVKVECKPFAGWTNPPADGILVTNPPYGERLRIEDMEGLYRSIGTTLKNNFQGYHAWLIGYRDEYFREIGLKPSVRFPMLNGALECELREYVLFDGSYARFREEGGSVANHKFNRETGHKVRRMTDEEWSRESKKFNDKGRDRKADRNERRPKDFDRSERPRRDSDFRRNDSERPRRDSDFRRNDSERLRRDSGFRRNDSERPRRDSDFRRNDSERPRRDSDFRRKDSERPRRDFDSRQKGKPSPLDTIGKGPTLPESSATVFETTHFRSRKGKNKEEL